MQSLRFPFILESNFTKCHKICLIQLILQYQKLATGSLNGDIIIWQIKENLEGLDPKIFCIPSLNQNSGRINCLTLISKPLQYYTVNNYFNIKTKKQKS